MSSLSTAQLLEQLINALSVSQIAQLPAPLVTLAVTNLPVQNDVRRTLIRRGSLEEALKEELLKDSSAATRAALLIRSDLPRDEFDSMVASDTRLSVFLAAVKACTQAEPNLPEVIDNRLSNLSQPRPVTLTASAVPATFVEPVERLGSPPVKIEDVKLHEQLTNMFVQSPSRPFAQALLPTLDTGEELTLALQLRHVQLITRRPSLACHVTKSLNLR